MDPYCRITIVDIEDGSYGQAVDARLRMRELWNDDMGISEDDCPRGWVHLKEKTISPTGDSACSTTSSVIVGSGVNGHDAAGRTSQVLPVPMVALKLP